MRVDGHKRTIILPPALAGFEPTEAKLADGALEVTFDESGSDADGTTPSSACARRWSAAHSGGRAGRAGGRGERSARPTACRRAAGRRRPATQAAAAHGRARGAGARRAAARSCATCSARRCASRSPELVRELLLLARAIIDWLPRGSSARAPRTPRCEDIPLS